MAIKIGRAALIPPVNFIRAVAKLVCNCTSSKMLQHSARKEEKRIASLLLSLLRGPSRARVSDVYGSQ